jgi:hypothetical protein
MSFLPHDQFVLTDDLQRLQLVFLRDFDERRNLVIGDVVRHIARIALIRRKCLLFRS